MKNPIPFTLAPPKVKYLGINLKTMYEIFYRKTVKLKQNQRTKEIERASIFIARKTQYCQDVSSSQPDLQLNCSSNKNPSKLFFGY